MKDATIFSFNLLRKELLMVSRKCTAYQLTHTTTSPALRAKLKLTPLMTQKSLSLLILLLIPLASLKKKSTMLLSSLQPSCILEK